MRATGRWPALLAAALLAVAGSALAHDGHRHAPAKATPATMPVAAFPVPVGVDFTLVDQSGRRRSLASFAGRHVLLFFGYANCDSICSAAIPLMVEARDALGDAARGVDTVMVTVDPARDTPAGLRQGLGKFGGAIIGLTGSAAELAKVWRGFHVSVSEVGRDPLDRPIYAHGSFVYLLGPDGKVLTILPPVLGPEAMAGIVRGYLR